MTDVLTYEDPTARCVAGLAALRGWTLAALAEHAGMSSVVLVQKMNRNQGKKLTGEDLQRLGDALGVDPFELALHELPALKVTDPGPLIVTRRYRMEPTG
jgi:transcriptional regulator with XRE-family HTH domain